MEGVSQTIQKKSSEGDTNTQNNSDITLLNLKNILKNTIPFAFIIEYLLMKFIMQLDDTMAIKH